MSRFTSFLFPRVVTFEFTVANGQMVKLSFPSNTKICDFIEDVKEKAVIAFGIPKNQILEITEIGGKSAYGRYLDTNDNSTLRDKYANNHHEISFYINTKFSI